MQEVTIRQRSAFKHFVTIDQPGKELCWNFFTRKKNISFGLYRKVNRQFSEGTYVLQNGTLREVGRSYAALSDAEGDKTSAPSSPSLTRARAGSATATPPDFADQPAGLNSFRETASTKSFTDATDGSVSARRRKGETFADPELLEIQPITHYESSKFTVKGSYHVEEPGT